MQIWKNKRDMLWFRLCDKAAKINAGTANYLTFKFHHQLCLVWCCCCCRRLKVGRGSEMIHSHPLPASLKYRECGLYFLAFTLFFQTVTVPNEYSNMYGLYKLVIVLWQLHSFRCLAGFSRICAMLLRLIVCVIFWGFSHTFASFTISVQDEFQIISDSYSACQLLCPFDIIIDVKRTRVFIDWVWKLTLLILLIFGYQ